MTSFLLRRLISQMLAGLSGLVESMGCRKLTATVLRSKPAPYPGVRVFYAHPHLTERLARAAGGMAKLEHLTSRFRPAVEGANIVYLVSSSLPRQAVRMSAALRTGGRRVVLNQNGVAYPAWHGPGWERLNRPMTHLLRQVDYVFYQSQFCKLSADRFLGKPGCRWEILYNCVDTKRFQPSGEGPKAGTVRLLLAGGHGRFYRVERAVETLRLVREDVPEARLIIAGPYRWTSNTRKAEQDVDRLIAQQMLQAHVTRIRSYSRAEAPDLFRGAHILLHPQYNDCCPTVVLEAMACGLPVVCSATGGTPELVGEDAGVGIPGPLDWDEERPPSSTDMAEGVLRVLSEWNTYSGAARSRAQSFDVRQWLDRHERVFENLIEEGGA